MRVRSPLTYKAKFRDTETESGEPVTIVTSLITNKDVDGHSTHLSEDSLVNFEKAENITLLDSHNHSTTGYGVSTRIWREEDNIFGDFAILQKSRWSDKMTYKNAEALLYDLRNRPFDTSIGFNSDEDICDLCAADGNERDIWFSEDCAHWLGDLYEQPGKEERVRATAEIRGAELYENSLVFAGSNDASQILSENQREQSVLKAERMLKDGKVQPETVLRMAKRMAIPELRAVGTSTKTQVFIPDKKRSQPKMRSQEALEARVEELEEEVEELTEEKTELKELYDKERKANKQLKADAKERKDRLSILEDIEEDLRDACLKVSKETDKVRKEEDRLSDDERKDLEKEIEEASYTQLRRKFKTLSKERDIVIEINKVETGEDADITLPDADDNKPVQPFMARGELDSRFL